MIFQVEFRIFWFTWKLVKLISFYLSVGKIFCLHAKGETDNLIIGWDSIFVEIHFVSRSTWWMRRDIEGMAKDQLKPIKRMNSGIQIHWLNKMIRHEMHTTLKYHRNRYFDWDSVEEFENTTSTILKEFSVWKCCIHFGLSIVNEMIEKKGKLYVCVCVCC